ncbi:MAG: hypothetical protein ACYTG5_16490 [Planctomycetota bacterium]
MSPAAGKKKKVAKKSAKKTAAKAPAIKDPRESLAPTPANLKSLIEDLRAALERLEKPAEPRPGDLVQAYMHIIFADGLPCGYGQEVLRRIDAEYVDRNEFRLTEAFEIAELIEDLDIPDALQRCLVVKNSIGEIYNDQNGVSMEALREAVVAERKSFFQRVPAITPKGMRFISDVMNLEEIATSPRSTQRVQLRMGLDPKNKAAETFVAEYREVIAPFGHLPLLVGPDGADGKPNLDAELCPTCMLTRLAPKGKR